MKKAIFTTLIILTTGIFFTSCDEVNAECKCYDRALNGSELSDECAELVEGMSEEELKDKSNACFGETVGDMSGAVGL